MRCYGIICLSIYLGKCRFDENGEEKEEKLNMAKKLIFVWLTLLMVLFSSISIYADENVQGDFFVGKIVINGEEIVNYNLQYPFITYNNSTYIPLTPEIGEICGFSAEMDKESRTLKLLKTDSTRQNISENWMKNNKEDMTLKVVSEARVLVYDANETEEEDTDAIKAPKLFVDELDLSEQPVLSCGQVIYLPLRAIATEEKFNWDIYYNVYYGVAVSTKEGVTAESLCDKSEEALNKGLANYIRHTNPGVTAAMANEYVQLFKRASTVYNTDIKLLMAMAQRESTFNANATARGGSIGMMQIMPATGAYFGLSKNDLYDAKTNIDFGAMYISERIAAYNGDWVKGLSAYNQGSARVNRGAHSTAYANRIIGSYNTINNYLKINGYVSTTQ